MGLALWPPPHSGSLNTIILSVLPLWFTFKKTGLNSSTRADPYLLSVWPHLPSTMGFPQAEVGHPQPQTGHFKASQSSCCPLFSLLCPAPQVTHEDVFKKKQVKEKSTVVWATQHSRAPAPSGQNLRLHSYRLQRTEVGMAMTGDEGNSRVRKEIRFL